MPAVQPWACRGSIILAARHHCGLTSRSKSRRDASSIMRSNSLRAFGPDLGARLNPFDMNERRQSIHYVASDPRGFKCGTASQALETR
jgi:hypothetical protein